MESNCSAAKLDSAKVTGMSDAEADEEEAKDEESHVDELEDFRRKWQHEIEATPSNSGNCNNILHRVTNDVPQRIEEQARTLFLCGVQAERAGMLERAISYYRRAVQLVPDIEFRVTEYSNDNSDSYSDDSGQNSDRENMEQDDEDEDISNLVEKFQRIAFKSGITATCLPKLDQKGKHISALPPEILIFILKWVVSGELDLFSLEKVSKVCRGFYLCARDPEIWRLSCLRIWEVNLGSPNRYGGWRNMFILRPHLLFNGAYISKTTYIRYGEPSFQDSNYRPCYLVSYFRYLRFFPDGLVMMLTTPDDPYQSLFKLRSRKSKHSSIHFGRYKLVGNTVIAVVKKAKGDAPLSTMNYYKFHRHKQAANLQEAYDQTFHVELEIKNVKKRANCQLTWKQYSIQMVYRNGQDTASDFDLSPSNFPPFWFSRVKSYSSETESLLK